MRILISDDTLANLEAAKEASKGFSEHEFVFVSTANEASSLIKSVDAVITDLIYPQETLGNKLNAAYNKYLKGLSARDSDAAFLVAEYYQFNFKKFETKKKLMRAFATEGTVKLALETALSTEEPGTEWYKKYEKILNSLPKQKEFPYGGAIMLLAKKQQKKLCLVTSVHSHASLLGVYDKYTGGDIASGLDGMILLMPLIQYDILGYTEATLDGRLYEQEERRFDDDVHHGTYMGESVIKKIGGSKQSPMVWTEAIRKVLAQ